MAKREKYFGRKLFIKIIIVFMIILFTISIFRVGTYTADIKRARTELQNQYVDIITTSIEVDEGIHIVGDIYLPKNINHSASYPAVILQHGMGGRRGNMLSFAVNFIKRGFVVAAFDLRGHGDSNGYNTLGNKESDDILKVIEYLRTKINDNYVNISQIALVGHSLGALTVTIAAYKSGVNACVAIAPPAFIPSLFNDILGNSDEIINEKIGFNNPLNDPAYIKNITLSTWVSNRTESNPRPKNLLLITTEEDKVVPANTVYDLFKNITHQSAPLNNTLYGNFEKGTATELDVFPKGIHGNEQFPFATPNITQATIKWVERAIFGPNATTIRGDIKLSDLEMDNPTALWGPTQLYYIYSFIGFTTAIMLFFLLKTYGKESDSFKKLPPYYHISIIPLKHLNQQDQKDPANVSDNSGTRNRSLKIFSVNLIVLFALAFVSAFIAPYLYAPHIIGNFLSELIIHTLLVFTLPIIIFSLIFLYFARKNISKIHDEKNKNSNDTKDTMDISNIGDLSHIRIMNFLGIADTNKIFVRDTILGIIFGLYLPLGLVLISNYLSTETIFKRIIFYDQFLKGAVSFFILAFFIEIFMNGYIRRLTPEGPTKKKVLRFILAPVLQIAISFIIAALSLQIDLAFAGFFSYYGINIDLRIAGVLILTALVSAISIAGLIYSETTKSSMMPILFSSILIPWFLMSIMPII
ncbi:MAG: alpha/beta hydrolase family protein [Promethearchaeota archaeon]